jgi:argininosuccinate lyase
LNALPLADWQAISPHFEADVLGVFNFERSLASRDVVGGTSPRAARAQIRQAERWLKKRQCQSDE